MAKLKLGVALGAGSARGLCHIGILKVLHKHKIYPDYIAGTSMGAVIAAAYASGRSLDEIAKISKTTDWKKIVDFTIPKMGLLQGRMIESKLRNLTNNKEFKDLEVPLRIVSYNLTKRQKVVFSKGSVAKAVRASISIPGIFAPLEIDDDLYIDGGVADPTPYDVVKEMGADVILAVDLFPPDKGKTKAPVVHDKSLGKELKEKFISDELSLLKSILFPQRWPRAIRRLLMWTFDKLLYPAKVMRMLAGRELFPITKIMFETMGSLFDNLAHERLKNADVDVIVRPRFGNLVWTDFNKVDKFVRVGQNAMNKKISDLKKKLRIR